MFKTILHKFVIALLAIVAVACVDKAPEPNMPNTPDTPAEGEMVNMVITVEGEASRTELDMARQMVRWQSDDKLMVIENDTRYATSSKTTLYGDGKASFEVVFERDITSDSFTYDAIYPADNVSFDEGVYAELIKVELPAKQYPTAQSFDPDADILVAKHTICQSQPTELAMRFKRLVALSALELEDIPEEELISEVAITLISQREDVLPLAGCNLVNGVEGSVFEYGYGNASATLTLLYDEPVAADAPVYFTCNPQTLEGGDSFVVRVVTDRATYTRMVTIAEGCILAFDEGDMTKFSVDMASAKVEPHELCFKRATSVRSGGYYLLAAEGLIATPITSEYGYIQVVEGDSDGDGVIMQKGLDNAYLIESTSSGYTIKQASDDRYLYMKGSYDSFNLSSTIISGCDWTITAQSGNTFKIYNTAKSKFIQYSTQHTSYGCYSSMKSYGVMPQLYELTSTVVPPAQVVGQPKLSELYASWSGSVASVGCVVENPEYILGGMVYFTFESSDGDTVEQSYNVSGMETYAYITDIALDSNEKYSVVAWCYDSNNERVATETITLSTAVSGGGGVATPSESWLELPAQRTDGRYPKAAEYKVWSGGERNYTHYYDIATYTTLWVAYPIEAKHMGSISRPSNWTFNPLIDEAYQVNLCNRSYTNSDTYVRGHLIPNASRNGIKEMQLQTFYVTNSVPQIHTNFNSGIWQSLEAALQSIAESETIYVVTGVAFSKEGENRTISYTTAKDDTKQVPIPNYFYKVVLKVNTNSSGVVTSASTVGFWFENQAYSNKTYSNYAVSVDQIEEWTGFDYFANLPDDIEVQVEKNSSWSSFSSF